MSRNVIFYEYVFPLKNPLKPTPDPTPNPLDNNHPLFDPDMDPFTNHPTLLDSDLTVHSTAPETPNITHTPSFPDLPISLSPQTSPLSQTLVDFDPNSSNAFPSIILDANSSSASAVTPLLSIRKCARAKNLPNYLKDYHCSLLPHCTISFSIRVPYPLSTSLSYHTYSPSYKKFFCIISSIPEPKTYAQASKLDCWKKAMDTEMDALEENQTWNIVDLPAGKVLVC